MGHRESFNGPQNVPEKFRIEKFSACTNNSGKNKGVDDFVPKAIKNQDGLNLYIICMYIVLFMNNFCIGNVCITEKFFGSIKLDVSEKLLHNYFFRIS